MYPSNFDYHRPKSLAEAADLLRKDPEAKLLAGGHSLLPAMKFRLATPSALVDLAGLADLRGIAADDGKLTIGALTTHDEVSSSSAVRSSCGLLAETASQIGDPQVRHRGTLGGSVAHADPAADYPTALVALEATVKTGGAASRSIPIGDFFKGLFTTALGAGEIVTAVSVPTYGKGTGAAYVKHAHPASGYAVVGAAAIVTLAGGKVTRVRLVIGGTSANPIRAAAAESALTGQAPTEGALQVAAASVESAITSPSSDLYASGYYRRHLATVLARRALALAVERAS